ncbi:unnamed protein product [Lupinus luteus]|uniref:Phosphomannose isomerase type I C-terminal domain-containing protein n=1 Tax=Lupinus luteus TaxID=3873 RepID=A0AAV1WZ22_LUPLU
MFLQGSPEILRGVPLNPYVNRYIPPFDEFEIDRCILPEGETLVFPAIPGPSIFLVTIGEGTNLFGHTVPAEDQVGEPCDGKPSRTVRRALN